MEIPKHVDVLLNTVFTAVTSHTRPSTIFSPFQVSSFGGCQSNVSMTEIVFILCQFHCDVRSSLDQVDQAQLL